jgi:hypothetical protein
MSPLWQWPSDAVHRLEVQATPEQWGTWNAAARLSGVAVEVWLTQAGDAHARNLERAVKRADGPGSGEGRNRRKRRKRPAPGPGREAS